MSFPLNIQNLITKMLAALKPPENISVTECAEKYRILPASNREGGNYRVNRTPFAKEIMDCFDDPELEECSVMGSAQWAKTTSMENIILKIIMLLGGNILLLFPTLDFGRRFSKTRLEPMIEDSPEVKKVVAKRKSRDSNNTILSKAYQGGTMYIIGANSSSGLRGYTAPYILADDIDAVKIAESEDKESKEGDFMERAERAAETFEGMRKIFRFSTPGRWGESRIYNSYVLGSQEHWFMPCPHCNEFQSFDDINMLIWDYEKDAFDNKILGTDKPSTAKLVCKHCGALISEPERQKMLLLGKWVAKYPDRKHHRSFYFNRFGSPFSSLQHVCKKYIEALADPSRMETFTNLFMGKPYKIDTIEEIDEFELMNRLENYLEPSEPYVVPNTVLFLVCSVDVQKDRLEYEIWGYGMFYEQWIINKDKILGDTKQQKNIADSPWLKLEKILMNIWHRRDGVELKIAAAAIDSSYNTDEVYNFTRGYNFTRKWWSIKGSRNPFAEIIPNKFSTIEEKRSHYLNLGVNKEKQLLFSRLKDPIPKGYKEGEPIPKFIHFDESLCGPEYFEQLTAEHGVKKTNGSQEYVVYEPKRRGARNEALDLLVYNSIMAKMVNPNFEKLKSNLLLRAEEIKKQDKPEKTEQAIVIEQKEPEKQPLLKKISNFKIKKTNSITNW